MPRASCGMLLLALLAALLSTGCGKTVVYDQDDYLTTHQKEVFFLEPTYLPPAPEGLHQQVVEQTERFLASSPHLGQVRTRAGFAAETKTRPVRAAYELLSDTVSVVGLGERELGSILLAAEGIPLAATAQFFYMPCDICEEGDQASVVAQVLELGTAKLLLRVHVTRTVSGGVDTLPPEVSEMVEEVFTELNNALRPKPHRQRYDALRALRG